VMMIAARETAPGVGESARRLVPSEASEP
jgi:hypothetical protein